MSDDVWESGSGGPNSGGDDSMGVPDYENGSLPNETFSVDAVFKAGLAFLQEAPAVALLGGFNMLLIAFLPSLIATPLSVAVTVTAQQSGLDDMAVQGLSQLSSMAVQLVFWPITQLVVAGIIVSAAKWIRTDEADISSLYTSVGAAVRAFLATLVAAIISFLAALVTMVPAMLAIGVGIGIDNVTLGLGLGGLLFIPAFFVMVYVGLGVQLTVYAAVLDGLGPIEAVQRSWEAASGTRVTLFVTGFVFGILGSVAACMCFLPLMLVVPIQQGGMTAAWLRYARHSDESSKYPFFERNV